MVEHKVYPFEFSVIMAVYNVEPWLREAVDSLIAQDFGFENIQLILVDDGSTDGSGLICDEYAKRYPDHVLVIHKENGGVASARNEGLKYATGRFLNFMDPDDKLSSNTMTAVYTFYSAHMDKTDVVSIPLVFFDGATGSHPLNWKFEKGTRVIDLFREPSMIQLSIASTFVKHEALQGKSFNVRLAFAEDAKLLQQIFMNLGTLGVLETATYHYRKRSTGELSAIQKSQNMPEWYFPYLTYFAEDLIREALCKYGSVPKFIQYAISYDLQWRLKQQHVPEDILGEQGVEEYRKRIVNLLRYIDDDIILQQKSIWHEHKLFALMKKHDGKVQVVRKKNDAFLRFGNTTCYHLSNCQFTVEFIELNAEKCVVEGYTIIYPLDFSSFDIYAQVNGCLYKCEKRFRNFDVYSLDEPILTYYGFPCELPLEHSKEVYAVKFFIKIDDMLVEKRTFTTKNIRRLDVNTNIHITYPMDGN